MHELRLASVLSRRLIGYNQVAFIITDVNCQLAEVTRMATKLVLSQIERCCLQFARSATFAAVMIASVCLAAESPPVELPNQVAKKVEMQTRMIKQLWKGQGNVVVGKLQTPSDVDPQQIAARTILLNDGWFAARLFPARTLSFRAHGYKPIDIQPPKDAPLVYNVGTIKLEAVDKKDLTTVRGIATSPKEFEGKRILIELELEQPPPIFADYGYEGGTMQPVVNQLYMPPGEEFRFEKLSNFDYRLRISAPHCIVKEVPLPAAREKDFNVGKQTLVPSPLLVFDYVSQFSDMPSAETKQKSIECDDHNTFVFAKERDDWGNTRFLRLHPDDGKVLARFWYSPSAFYDLGKANLKDEIAKVSLERFKKMDNLKDEQLLEDGHAYYFECPDRKANCLFSVTVPTKHRANASSDQKIPN
jgi:hypothetical protein